MSAPYTVRWGILATGWIAATFTKDLMLDPSTRGVHDIAHTVTAAASSTSSQRAREFLTECQCPPSASAYGSYEELVQDPNVDIIYIATPHSHHYQNAMLCLLGGKHVLCEKAFTTNAAQTQALISLAREKNLFLMEAVWTRFFPLSIQIRSFISRGEAGAIHRVIADNSFGKNVEQDYGESHRMTNLALAGGALLDLGVYSLTWCFQTLYHTLPPQDRAAPSVVSTISKYSPTGADENTSMLLTFPHAPPAGGSQGGNQSQAHGIALTNFRVATDPDGFNTARPAVRIEGTRGEIQVDGPAYRPTTWRFIPVGGTGKVGDGDGDVKEFECEIPGKGMFWEADECARCLKEGKTESEGMGWEESTVIMQVMDEVRRQNGLVYPERIESLEYPLEL